ncbi:hypothetical protein M8J75_016604 [Diaphorina citri]|nr:hypothetical protein M8J75_016604 [Diaphorina citri]
MHSFVRKILFGNHFQSSTSKPPDSNIQPTWKKQILQNAVYPKYHTEPVTLIENPEILYLQQLVTNQNLLISKLKKTSPNKEGLCKDAESQTKDLQENVVLSDIINDRDKMKAALEELEKINNDVMSNCDELKLQIEELKNERDFEKHMKEGFQSSFDTVKNEFIRVTAVLKENYSHKVKCLQKVWQQETLENKTLRKRLDEVQTDRDNLFEQLKLMNQLSEHRQIPGVTNTIQVEDEVAFSHDDSTFVSKMFKDNQSQTEEHSEQEQDDLQKQKIIIEKQRQENRDLLEKIELFDSEKNKVDSEIKHLKEESQKLLEEKDNLRVALERRESRVKVMVEKVTELNFEVKWKILLSEYNVRKHCQELEKLRLTLDEKEKNIKELRDRILILETSLEEQRKEIIETQPKYTQYEIIETEPKYTQCDRIESESKHTQNEILETESTYTQYEIFETESKSTQCQIIESESRIESELKCTQYEILETESKYTQCEIIESESKYTHYEILETESTLTQYEIIESGSNATQYSIIDSIHSNSMIEDENHSLQIDLIVTDQTENDSLADTENDFKSEVFKSKRSSNRLCSSDHKLIEITNRYEQELFDLTEKYVRLYEEKSSLKKELDKKEVELKEQTKNHDLESGSNATQYSIIDSIHSNSMIEDENHSLQIDLIVTDQTENDSLADTENDFKSEVFKSKRSSNRLFSSDHKIEITNRYEQELFNLREKYDCLYVEKSSLKKELDENKLKYREQIDRHERDVLRLIENYNFLNKHKSSLNKEQIKRYELGRCSQSERKI